MTAEATLYALIGPLVGSRVYPDVAEFATPRPYVTYQKVGGFSIKPLDRGIPDKVHGLYQINVWADSRAVANDVARQIEDALRTTTAFSAVPDGEFRSDHDPDLNRYGTRQDFSIWSTR